MMSASAALSRNPLAALNQRVRARFPMIDRDSSGEPRLYLNNGAGSLTVDTAAEASGRAQGRLNPMPGTLCPAEIETAALHQRVRALATDFLNARNPAEISFHQSATAALFHLAFALRRRIGPGQNLVVTDLDHMANVSPWETIFGDGHGLEVRRARVTAEGTLDIAHLLDYVDDRTALVALTSASNATGSLVPLAEVAAEVKRRSEGCLICVDAVHHAPHGPIDVRSWEVDFLVFSGYKLFGPMLGVLWTNGETDRDLLPYRVETNRDIAPGRHEMGMLNNASLAALEAALEYLLWLADEAETAVRGSADRALRFRAAMTHIATYERGLSRLVLEGLREMGRPRVRLFGIEDPALAGERVPTFAFDLPGLTATETKRRLWHEARIQIADGNHYSAAVVRHLGRPEGISRASFAHYDNAESVERFLQALRGLAANP